MLNVIRSVSASLIPPLESLGSPRLSSQSYLDSAYSIWSLHDETINIWSHLVAAGYHGISALVYLTSCQARRVDAEAYATISFAIAATQCFSCSALYHTFSNHRNAGFWQRMDHFGISTFIWASSAAFSVLCFAERPSIRFAYTTVVTAFAMLSLWQLQQDVSHWDEISWARFTIHAIYGSLASLPALHCASSIAHQSSQAQRRLLTSFCTFVLLNSIGGVIYATEFVERITTAESRFVGTSHQVMHIFAIVASLVFQSGIRTFCVRSHFLRTGHSSQSQKWQYMRA